jgi:hypothetical protein
MEAESRQMNIQFDEEERRIGLEISTISHFLALNCDAWLNVYVFTPYTPSYTHKYPYIAIYILNK